MVLIMIRMGVIGLRRSNDSLLDMIFLSLRRIRPDDIFLSKGILAETRLRNNMKK